MSPNTTRRKVPAGPGWLGRWKHSLYSRALLFTVIGSGCLLGAIIAQSWVMVNGTVERLLQERMSLARATGSYLEEVLHHDLDQMVNALTPILKEGGVSLSNRPALRQALSNSYFGTVFREGAFVLDPDANPIATVPEADPSFLKRAIDLRNLAAQAQRSPGPIVSPLTILPTGNRPVIILLHVIKSGETRVLGYVGGIIHPASDNLLKPFEKGSIGTAGALQLLDATGAVVASTRQRSLFELTDHGSMLSGAIRNKKEVRGRCHSCHDSGGTSHTRNAREMEVLAFAPLPTLSLGIAVRQPESEALGPAFSLERRLVILGLGFIVLFLIFTGLSVYSVVSPLTRLTRAVKNLEGEETDQKLPSFGKDEVGQLAGAVERWRSRMIESVSALKRQEAVLAHEIAQTQRNLAALQEIAEFSSHSVGVEAVLQKGLTILLEFTHLSRGYLELSFHNKQFRAIRGVTPDELPPVPNGEYRTTRLKVFDDLSVSCILAGGPRFEAEFEERRLQSMLHQIVISVANRLLHEEEAQRHRQSREFLQKLLNAQEEERKRIARELHDTIAQDLAAHRLELERLLAQIHQEKDLSTVEARVRKIESKAHDMLVSLRQMLLDLRPSVLDTMGFLPALQWYLERVRKTHGIRGTLSIEADNLRLNPGTEVALFRIFQEALQNIVQHAQAQTVIVTVSQAGGMLEMSIEDDGKGFDPAELDGQPKAQGRGLGVLGMKERSSLLGGELAIQSKPGEGASFIVKIPYESDTHHSG